MRASTFVVIALVFVSFARCSSLPQICEADQARAAGRSQAMQGKEADVTIGAACVGDQHTAFRTQYSAGYREGLATYCNADAITKWPFSSGETGVRVEFPEHNYKVCENVTELRASFQRANREGLATFCMPAKAAEAGRVQGDAGRATEFDAVQYAACDSTLPALRIAYLEAQATGLARFCRADGVEAQGEKAGREGKPSVSVADRFSACPQEQKTQAQARFEAGYERGLAVYCDANNLRASANAQSRNVNTPRFPEEYRTCLAKFPELATQFEILFRDARQNHVEGECTYARGQEAGTRDAQTGNRKKTDLPLFCNATLFPVFLNGYLDAWKSTKDRLCAAGDAYDLGMRDARFGHPLDYQAPTLCPTEMHGHLFQKYREGYHFTQLRAGTQAPRPSQNQLSADYARPTYPVERAQEACLRKGFKAHQCQDVTSIGCIEMGHSPFQCDLQSDHMVAVDACLRRGHSPMQCEDVKNLACIEAGKAPLLCSGTDPQVAWPSTQE